MTPWGEPGRDQDGHIHRHPGLAAETVQELAVAKRLAADLTVPPRL